MSNLGRIALAGIGLAACLSVTGAAYYYSSRRPQAALIALSDSAAIERGRVLYASECAGCHGSHGEGQSAAGISSKSGPLAPPHDGSGHTWQHPDFALIELTKKGISDVACRKIEEGVMPKFEETLNDRDIVDVLTYIKSTWSEETIASQERINRLYQTQNSAMRDVLELGADQSSNARK